MMEVKKWVPPLVVTFTSQPFFTSIIAGERVAWWLVVWNTFELHVFFVQTDLFQSLLMSSHCFPVLLFSPCVHSIVLSFMLAPSSPRHPHLFEAPKTHQASSAWRCCLRASACAASRALRRCRKAFRATFVMSSSDKRKANLVVFHDMKWGSLVKLDIRKWEFWCRKQHLVEKHLRSIHPSIPQQTATAPPPPPPPAIATTTNNTNN